MLLHKGLTHIYSHTQKKPSLHFGKIFTLKPISSPWPLTPCKILTLFTWFNFLFWLLFYLHGCYYFYSWFISFNSLLFILYVICTSCELLCPLFMMYYLFFCTALWSTLVLLKCSTNKVGWMTGNHTNIIRFAWINRLFSTHHTLQHDVQVTVNSMPLTVPQLNVRGVRAHHFGR